MIHDPKSREKNRGIGLGINNCGELHQNSSTDHRTCFDGSKSCWGENAHSWWSLLLKWCCFPICLCRRLHQFHRRCRYRESKNIYKKGPCVKVTSTKSTICSSFIIYKWRTQHFTITRPQTEKVMLKPRCGAEADHPKDRIEYPCDPWCTPERWALSRTSNARISVAWSFRRKIPDFGRYTFPNYQLQPKQLLASCTPPCKGVRWINNGIQ